MISTDQAILVSKFCPEMVGGISAPLDSNQDSISYSDYMMNIKKQILCARNLKELLLQHGEDFSVSFGE